MANGNLNNILTAIREATPDLEQGLRQRTGRHLAVCDFLAPGIAAISNSEALSDCTPRSVVACFFEAAGLNMVPCAPDKNISMVPRGGRATLVIGYRALIKLMMATNKYLAIYAHAYYEGDEVSILQGSTERITHTLNLVGGGGVLGYYMVAKLNSGIDRVCRMTLAETRVIRDRVLSKLDDKKRKVHPWTTDETEMGVKTVLRRGYKQLEAVSSIDNVWGDEDDGGEGEGDKNAPLFAPTVVIPATTIPPTPSAAIPPLSVVIPATTIPPASSTAIPPLSVVIPEQININPLLVSIGEAYGGEKGTEFYLAVKASGIDEQTTDRTKQKRLVCILLSKLDEKKRKPILVAHKTTLQLLKVI